MSKKRILAIMLAITAFVSSNFYFSPQIRAEQEKEQPGGMWGPSRPGWWDEWHSPHMREWHQQRMQRHWRFMHGEVPKEYADLKNPVEFTTANIQEGGKLYQQSCQQCHGKRGMGDGEAAKNLRPSPALLAYLIQRPIAADSYLMWTISEGGVSSKTEMPAFKNTLSQEQIWKIIAYMHSGFPELKEEK